MSKYSYEYDFYQGLDESACPVPNSEAEIFGFRVVGAQVSSAELLEDIRTITKNEGLFMKTQTWRGDEAGLELANACKGALGRGSKVSIFKDQIGASFEGGEGNGQSFWHSRNWILDLQAAAIKKFYDNESKTSSVEIEAIEACRDELLGTSNFNFKSGYRYDHSKLALIYDEKRKIPLKAYIGGASVGNEWRGKKGNQYFDGVTIIENPFILSQIVKSLKGQGAGWVEGVKILTNNHTERENYYSTFENHVLGVKGSVEMAISYMGASNLINLLEGKDSVHIITPYQAAVNRDRNWHFMYELIRRVEKDFKGGMLGQLSNGKLLSYWWDFLEEKNYSLPESMKITPLDRMSHLKAIVLNAVEESCCDFAGLGSANIVSQSSAFNEMGIGFKGDSERAQYGINQVQSIVQKAAQHRDSESQVEGVGMNYLQSDLVSDHTRPQFSLLRSQVEHFIMSYQETMSRMRRAQILKIQQQEQDFFSDLFPRI